VKMLVALGLGWSRREVTSHDRNFCL